MYDLPLGEIIRIGCKGAGKNNTDNEENEEESDTYSSANDTCGSHTTFASLGFSDGTEHDTDDSERYTDIPQTENNDGNNTADHAGDSKTFTGLRDLHLGHRGLHHRLGVCSELSLRSLVIVRILSVGIIADRGIHIGSALGTELCIDWIVGSAIFTKHFNTSVKIKYVLTVYITL